MTRRERELRARLAHGLDPDSASDPTAGLIETANLVQRLHAQQRPVPDDAFVQRLERTLMHGARQDSSALISPADRRSTSSGRTTLRPNAETRFGRSFGQWSRNERRRNWKMSTLSSLAATIVVAVGIYAAIPAIRPKSGSTQPTAQVLPAANGSALTIPAADGGNPPSGTGDPAGFDLSPLSPDDCTVAPRVRADALQILSTAPAADPGPPGLFSVASDQVPLVEIQRAYREWQACARYGQTWRAMALETDAFIRMDIYGTWDFIDRRPVVAPYSESTLAEILDGRELIDAAQSAAWAEVPRGGPSLCAIDTSQPVEVSDDGAYVTLHAVKVTGTDGESIPREGMVSFEFAGGQWRLASTPSLFLD